MTRQSELRLAWGSGWICASRMSVIAALWLTHEGFTALSARKPPAGQLDIMPWMTWLLWALLLLVSLSRRSQWDCFRQMESDLMVLHLSHGTVGVARHYMLGRHSKLSVSQFVCSWSRSWGRFSSRACCCPQGGQIFQHWRPILIWTDYRRDFGHVQHVGSPAPFWLWQKDFPVFRDSQRGELSLSEILSAGAAFQRSFTAQQFAGLWLHRLMVIPNTSFS